MAIDMQGAVQDLIVHWRAHGHAIGFGIGIATGEATVGRIGYEGRIDYTAIGPVVNLASRLCSTAVDGQVIIDVATAAALDDALPVEISRRPADQGLRGADRDLHTQAADEARRA